MTDNIKKLILFPLVIGIMLSGCAPAAVGEPVTKAQEETAESEQYSPIRDVYISEFMEKNKSCITDEDGDFSDWIELYNSGDGPVSLAGWHISDKADEKGWPFPDICIAPGEYLLLFASNKDRASGTLHTDFAISGDEGVYLRDADGKLASEAACGNCKSDVAMSLEQGVWQKSTRPTPGFENSGAGYDLFQESLGYAGPLVINEMMSYDDSVLWSGNRGFCDWLELKNVSGEPLLLSDYCLSDDDKNYGFYNLPETWLEPGKCFVVLCDDEPGDFYDLYPNCGFALNGEGESIYLSERSGKLVDFCSMPKIPYALSYGRNEGQNGWFYMEEPSPLKDNVPGCRGMAEKPQSPTKDGVFDNADEIEVQFSCSDTIRYTLDGSRPTEESPEYTGPLTLTETCVVRAAGFREGRLPSEAITLSFIINEGHSLPVMSFAADDPLSFRQMYDGMDKNDEQPGYFSFYRGEESFGISCGISLNGQTSLVLPKKNMSLHFRSAYGDEMLEHDIYGGGVTEFGNLLLRSGQDHEYAIIRNELCQKICELADMETINQRSIWCVLYINGEYSGLYTLKEKNNAQHYASLAGVSRDSIVCHESPVPFKTELFQDVMRYAVQNDMSEDENYRELCSRLDVDSLIDWLIIEGFCGNTDISLGNLRYCRSSENDGKWRLMFYDLDASFTQVGNTYENLLTEYAGYNVQVGSLVWQLMRNDEFRDRFLTRAGQLYSTVLTDETVLELIDSMVAEIEPEVPRDYGRYCMDISRWHWHLDKLRSIIKDGNWQQSCIDSLSAIFKLSPEEREYYFGETELK